MKGSRPDISDGGRSQPPSEERELFVGCVQRAAAVSAAAKKIIVEIDKRASAARLEKRLVSLRQELQALTSLAGELEAMETSWSNRVEREFLEIEASMRDALTSMGWHVDGQWPRFYVARGVAVEFDGQSRSFRVAGRKISDASISDVIRALEPLVADLIPSDFSEPKFIQLLADAYDDVAAESSQVPILDVYRQFVLRQQKQTFWRDARSGAFVELTMDQFRARLSKALEKGVITDVRGREIRLLPPIDPKNAIFIYQPAERRFGFVGRIEFISSQQLDP
ncbi:hypothetical protein [Bradyrhizobium sp. 33ap4]|uniref:hypothetical protein n=1 Tax=Bradyrhizobium sp. 33ap4 TaxID=3061630 RepID=UPI00292D7E6F|nr:hypothetical protein [Bradyrhizobium sp. 33ap4]